MKLLRSLCVLITFAASPAAFGADQCADILKGGTMARLDYSSNSYSRLVLAARFSSMTKSQAESEMGGAANFPIDGVPIGANYSEKQFNEWKQDVRKSIDVNSINQNSTQILASSGDPVIASAWRSCMQSRGGLAASFDQLDKDNVVLSIVYYPYPGSSLRTLPVKGSIVGGVFDASAINLKNARLDAGVEVQVPIRRLNPKKPLLVTFNSKIGASRAYLPANIIVPRAQYISKSKDVFALSGAYGKASKGSQFRSGGPGAPRIAIQMAPGERPADLTNLLANVQILGVGLTNLQGGGVGLPGPLQLFNPIWDASSSTLSMDWNTGVANGRNDWSEYLITVQLRVSYFTPN